MVGGLTGEREIVVQKITAAAERAYGRMEAGGQRVEMVGNIAYPVVVLIGKLEQEVFGPPACLCLVASSSTPAGYGSRNRSGYGRHRCHSQ